MLLGRRGLRRLGIGCVTVLLVAFGFLYLTGAGQFVRDMWSHGFIDQYLSPEAARKYNASNEQNLKSLYKAMLQYHESEGQFPQARGWMDGIRSFGAASDLAKGEADKKFVNPEFAGKPGKFGYAMNDAASGKYKGDLKDPKMPLLFESSDTSRNAHGDPKLLMPKPPRAGGNLGIAVDGTILKL